MDFVTYMHAIQFASPLPICSPSSMFILGITVPGVVSLLVTLLSASDPWWIRYVQ